jgi:hypothetical protein
MLTERFEKIQEVHEGLIAQQSAMQALLAKGEAKRLARVPEVEINNCSLKDGVIRANVNGLVETYEVRITLSPRGFHCMCADFRESVKKVGPCKHVLRVATEWLSVTNISLDSMYSVLDTLGAAEEEYSETEIEETTIPA